MDVDPGLLARLGDELRSLGLPAREVARQLDLVVKDSEALSEDGGHAAALMNALELRKKGSDE